MFPFEKSFSAATPSEDRHCLLFCFASSEISILKYLLAENKTKHQIQLNRGLTSEVGLDHLNQQQTVKKDKANNAILLWIVHRRSKEGLGDAILSNAWSLPYWTVKQAYLAWADKRNTLDNQNAVSKNNQFPTELDQKRNFHISVILVLEEKSTAS